MGKSANDQAKNIAARNGPVGPAVQRIATVIAKHKKLARLAFKELVSSTAEGKSERSRGQIRFRKSLTVEINISVGEVNRSPGHTDDAFDREPAIEGIAQHNNFSPFRRAQMEDPAIEQIELRIAKSRHHAHADDPNRLNQIMAD